MAFWDSPSESKKNFYSQWGLEPYATDTIARGVGGKCNSDDLLLISSSTHAAESAASIPDRSSRLHRPVIGASRYPSFQCLFLVTSSVNRRKARAGDTARKTWGGKRPEKCVPIFAVFLHVENMISIFYSVGFGEFEDIYDSLSFTKRNLIIIIIIISSSSPPSSSSSSSSFISQMQGKQCLQWILMQYAADCARSCDTSGRKSNVNV